MLNGFGDSFGRRVRRELSNEGGASRVLLEVGVNEVNSSVDLNFLGFLLLFVDIFSNDFKSFQESFLGQQ
jgi:hypothetical protein